MALWHKLGGAVTTVAMLLSVIFVLTAAPRAGSACRPPGLRQMG
jgi:hypothetical protein